MQHDRLDAHITHLVHCGAYAATMAVCAASVLNDPVDLPDGISIDAIHTDYWYHIGRRTQAIVDLCTLLDCNYATAYSLVVAAVPHEDDPADAYLPATLDQELT